MRMNRKAIILATAWLLSLMAVYSYAQKKAAAENTYKVVLDNECVRVREAVFQPGVKPPMHTHEYAHVGVIIEGGTLVFNYPDGKTETADLKTGGAGFREKNVTHQVINTGKKPVRVIEVELKQCAK